MSSSPSPSPPAAKNEKGALLHRLCPTCDIEILEERATCPDCGSKLVEVRDEIDQIVGTVIDERFEVRAKVGQGGMGTVYRAWQKSVGREVAIKLMDRSYSRDAMAVRRFLREARLASQLSQPNTVSVFDFGQAADGRLFIAMELIRGRTLHEVVQADGAFSIARCVRVGIQICDALDAAHALGIVHRDLKLENVIILDHPPGRNLIKVLDFGLAKNIRDPGSRATESGIVVGTPRYMSPESATTGTTGPAGDLYSLGVILGELASGKPMWTGETLTELIAQKLRPQAAIARAPAALRPLLERLLDPEPERRPTAEQTRTLLHRLDEAGSAGATDVIVATTDRSAATKAPAEVTVQLTPEKLALAPTGAVETPKPRARTEPGSTSISDGIPPAPSVVVGAPARSRWPLAAVGLGAVGAVVVAIVVASGGRHSEHAATPQPAAIADAAVTLAATPDAAPPPPPSVDAGAPAVVAPSATVTLHVTSDPSGASVTIGSTTRTTPFDLTVDRGTSPLALSAKLAGRMPAKLDIVPDGDKPVVIKLRPRRTGSTDEATPF